MVDCRRVRLRRAGTIVFADVVIDVARVASFAEAHAISEAVEGGDPRDRSAQGEADVVVHMEPVAAPDETPADAVRTFARLPRDARPRRPPARDRSSAWTPISTSRSTRPSP